MTTRKRQAGLPAGAPREAGLALLSALLAVVLLTIVVVELTDATLVGAHLSRNAGNAVAARLLARYAVAAGEALLAEEGERNHPTTSLDDDWAHAFPPVPAGQGTALLSIIIDEDRKLNLNALGGPSPRRVKEALEKLFSELGLDPQLVEAVEVWVRARRENQDSMEKAREVCQLPACEPRGARLGSLDELRLIRGFDEPAIRRLEPYVATRPNDASSVNPNTAHWRVLRAVGCDVGADFHPPPGGFTRVDDIEECSGEPRSLLNPKSEIFTISATGEVGGVFEHVKETVQLAGGSKVKPVAWVERPVSDLRASEVP